MSSRLLTSTILCVTAAVVMAGEHQGTPEHSGNIAESTAMLSVMKDLKWESVNILHDNTKDAQEAKDDMLQVLHARGVKTSIVMMETYNQSVEHCLSYTLQSHNVVLLVSSFPFLRGFLQALSQGAGERGLTRLLFVSHWLTLIPDDHRDAFRSLASPYQNVAVLLRSADGDLALWSILHEGDHSKLGFVASFPMAGPALTPLHVFPNLGWGLGGRTLTVIGKTHDVYLFETPGEANVTTYDGQLKDFLDHLAQLANFTYVIIRPTDSSWGQELDNGQWDGPIGMLTRKEADMALGIFTVTLGRASVADPVSFMYEQGIIAFRFQTRQKGNGLTFFLQPFQSLVYVLLGASFLFVLVVLLLLDKWNRVYALRRGPRKSGASAQALSWETLVVNVQFLFGSLMGKPINLEGGSRPVRVMLVTWLLLGVVVASLYGSKLTSSLTVTELELPFQTLSELLKDDSYTWGVPGGTADESFLQASSNKDVQEYYAKVVEFAKDDPDVFGGLDVQERKVVGGSYAAFTGSLMYENWMVTYCDIQRLRDIFMSYPLAVFLQKASPYTDVVAREVGKIVDSGLMDYWHRKWSREKTDCQHHADQGAAAISLSDMQAAFYLGLVGVGLAMLALLTERCFCLHR